MHNCGVPPIILPKLHPGPCSSVGVMRGTDRHTQTRVTTIHFAWSTTRAKCNYKSQCDDDNGMRMAPPFPHHQHLGLVSDIAIFVLKRDVKLQLTN